MLSLPILLAATFIAPSLGGYRVQNDLCNYTKYSSHFEEWTKDDTMIPLALMVTDKELFRVPSSKVQKAPLQPILSSLRGCQKALYSGDLFRKNKNNRMHCNRKMKKFTLGQAQLNALGVCEPCSDYQNQIIKCRNEEMFKFLENRLNSTKMEDFRDSLNKIWNYTGLTKKYEQISFNKGGNHMCDYQPTDEKNPVCFMCKWENYYPESMKTDYKLGIDNFELKPSFLHIDDTELYQNAFINVTNTLVCMKNYEKITKNPDQEVDDEARKECPYMFRFIRGQSELNHHGTCIVCDQKLNEMIKCRFKAFYKKVKTVYTEEQKTLFDSYLSQIRGTNQLTKAQMASMTNWLYAPPSSYIYRGDYINY